MIDEQKINSVCIQNGLTKMSISTFPTWVSRDKLEGVELKAGKLESFWYKDGLRVYGEPPSPSIDKILTLLENNTTNTNNIGTDNTTTLIPEQMTVPLLEKWQKMTVFERMLMFQKTAPQHIKTRKGKGGQVSYVEGNFMEMEANIAFLFKWDSEITGWDIREDGVACYGKIVVEIDGKTVTKSCVGNELQEYNRETKKGVFTVAEMMKSAHTDMKKKGLSALGFNGDVYRGEV